MFWIRYKARGAGNSLITLEKQLDLNPTNVEYPEFRSYKAQMTQDGATVIQRPLRDGRPRKWIWRGYGPAFPAFGDQWALLESLEYRRRLQDQVPAPIEIWEDVSGAGGFARKNVDGSRRYVQVRLVQADRTPRDGGGPVSFDSVATFLIDDPSYTAF